MSAIMGSTIFVVAVFGRFPQNRFFLWLLFLPLSLLLFLFGCLLFLALSGRSGYGGSRNHALGAALLSFAASVLNSRPDEWLLHGSLAGVLGTILFEKSRKRGDKVSY